MPAISTRFPTTRSTYLPSSTLDSYRSKSTYSSSNISSSTYGEPTYRRSSLIGSYRSSFNGDDTSTASSHRTGVSTRYTSTTTIPSTTSTSFTRKSIDRDFRSKPPIGSRIRSENRFRDLSLDNGYTTSSSTIKTNPDSSLSLTNSKRLSTTSLARSLATSGADLYDKYSVANYKPSCELSRSRSLTSDSKLIDSLNANHHSSSRRSTSKDRSSSGTLLAGSASDKDYLSNRSTSPISASVKQYVSNGATNPWSNSIVVSSASLTNPNNSSKICKKSSISSIDIGTKCGAIKKSSPKVTTSSSGAIESKNNLITPSNSKVNKGTTTTAAAAAIAKTTTNNNQNQTMNGYKSLNATITTTNNLNNNYETKQNFSSDSFKRRLGTNPLSPYKNPDFLKCEYDLARSQVINSRSRSACVEKNNNNNYNNNNNNSELTKTNGLSSTSLTSSPAKDSNRNSRLTIFAVNSASTSNPASVKSSLGDAIKSTEKLSTNKTALTDNNSNENMHANCVQHTVDILDDIKFIDSDDCERRHSPSTMNVASLKEFFTDNAMLSKGIKNTSTLPTAGASKKLNDIYSNKYNTITNGSCGHQANAHFSNGIARKAVPEEMLSSTSSSTSTLSAMTESSTSSLLPKCSAKENGTSIRLNHLDGGDSVSIRTSSVRSALPPTPNRDGKSTTSISSRILPDTDAFTKSLAASSISDKTSDTDYTTEGLCGLRNIGNTCFMNSIIQCLSHTKDLSSYLRAKGDIRSLTAAKDSRIVTEFAKLIKEMWSGSSSSVTPSELKLAFSSKHRMYSGCSQQDAQEFLRFFLDALHCALNAGTKGEKLEIDENLSNNTKADRTWEWYSKVENSVIKDLFVGQLKSSLKCTVCGNSSVTFDPFWDLSVSLPTSSRCKLESCLDLFIKEEVLDGDEMPTCSKCKTRRKSTKSFTIQRFPKYLVIHLKRFSETRWSKMTNIVEFPTGERDLNMGPYAANSTSVQYSLYGICNHMGSTAGGHYVAVCKHPITRKWHEFNDNVVSSIYDSGLVTSSAYVLFYERVHEINQINLINDTMHQSEQNFTTNSLFQLPLLSSSSHSSNKTNHFSNQTSTHADHSNAQLSYGFPSNDNANVIVKSIQNRRNDQFAIQFDNELRNRYSIPTPMINRNQLHGIPYYNMSNSGDYGAYMRHHTSMGTNHAVSYVITGITFYIILFYFIFG